MRCNPKKIITLNLLMTGVLFMSAPVFAFEQEIAGEMHVGDAGISETTAQIMAREAQPRSPRAPQRLRPLHRMREINPRQFLAQFPQAPRIARFPLHRTFDGALEQTEQELRSPQAISTSFTGATLSEDPLFPPDSMGAVGPTQFIVAINGIIRSFNKTTGLADGAINADTDVFFSSVRDGGFTSDPRIRYDRFSGRWFIIMINVPNNFNNNRLMIAVSDSGTITPSTVWRFFFFNAGTNTFLDYPTLGIDVNALYIGGQIFINHGNDLGSSKGYVVRKSSILGSGPIVVATFSNLININTGVGPYVPQGVDNFDPGATAGYFVAVDNAFFGRLILRRVSNPGGTPTISANIPLTIPTTQLPLLVPHLGNTNGRAGLLDSLDDRLFMAHIRKGFLWTAHNSGVNNTGLSSSNVTLTRNACRWYQINLSTSQPSLRQVGTLYASSANNDSAQRYYWMPSVMTSGQEHMALGCSTAGSSENINAAASGRLANDTLGTQRNATLFTSSSTAYNPSGDPGDAQGGRRWGDFSYTSVDPCDDMTMWTIQEFCPSTNIWGVQICKLLAPPPATPSTALPSIIAHGNPSVNITISGISSSGSGFFDPGASFGCRLTVSITGGVTVNSVTAITRTSFKINISTVGATTGAKNVTVTNPDGQSVTANGLISIT